MLTIDESANVQIGDPTDGAYVRAWVWVNTNEECGNLSSPENLLERDDAFPPVYLTSLDDRRGELTVFLAELRP